MGVEDFMLKPPKGAQAPFPQPGTCPGRVPHPPALRGTFFGVAEVSNGR